MRLHLPWIQRHSSVRKVSRLHARHVAELGQASYTQPSVAQATGARLWSRMQCGPEAEAGRVQRRELATSHV